MIASNLNPQTGAYYDVQRIFMEELKCAKLEEFTYARNLILVDTSAPNLIDDDGMNQMYNLADIGINTSDGEGFGLCQLEHLYTGAPQVVTGLDAYRAFLDETVAGVVPATGRSYFAGGMPHGLWYPTFDPEDVAKQIEHVVSHLDTMKATATTYSFKTWATVCDSFLETVLMSAGGQGTTGSGLVTSMCPSA
jgi:hypothetical protein